MSPKVFVGREEELATLSRWLETPDRRSILITGMGGIGKSALVAHLLRELHPTKRVLWLSAYENPTLASGFGEPLERIAQANPQVIVLDGVEQLAPQALGSWLNRIRGIRADTPVILTSRELLSVVDARTLRLAPLSSDEAVALLRNRLESNAEQELSALALRLGNHPLALALASALGSRMPVAELIAQLDSKIYELERQVSREPESIIQVVTPEIVSATDLLVERLRKTPNEIYQLSPRKFEELVAALLEDMGWEVYLTQQTRDGGRDILAYLHTDLGRLLCLVEAKRYNPGRPVGVELVRTLYGTLCDEQANSAMLVTTSYFTRGAREFQKKHVYQLALKEYQDVAAWIKKYSGRRL